MAATGNEFIKLQQLKTAMDSKQPDMTWVVKYNGATFSTSRLGTVNSVLFMDEDARDQINFNAPGDGTGADLCASSDTSATIRIQDVEANHEVLFRATPSSASFSIDSKSVSSITDAIADSPAGSALVTDKAVADYVDAHSMPSSTTAVDFVGDRYNKEYSMEDYALMVLVVYSNESYDPFTTAVVPMQLLDEVGQLTFAGDGYSPVRVSGEGGLVTVIDMNGGDMFKLYGIR